MDFMNNPEISALTERRTKLQDSTLEKLKAVLKPEQFEALPARGGEGRRRDDGGARGGGGEDGEQNARPRRRPGGNREGRPAVPGPV